MKMIRRAQPVLLVLFTLFFSSAARAADRWEPEKTWIFMVGLVTWKNSDDFESFPAGSRKDTVLLNTLRLRGVPDDHIVYLKDADATTDVVKAKFNEFVKRP